MQFQALLILVAFVSLSAGFTVSAFSSCNTLGSRHTLVGTKRCSHVRMQVQPGVESGALDLRGSRRAVLLTPLISLLAPRDAVAAANGFVVVLGATGETGQKCVEALVQRGKKVRAVSRSAVNSKGKSLAIPEDGRSLVEVVAGDVTKSEDLQSAIKGADAVIFAASASSKGGDPKAVDYMGLVKTAQVCIQERVPRLVVVSSGGVSRPDSGIYKLLNLFGEIMYYKAKGEDEIRNLYHQAANPAIGYTIVRPGGLTSGAASPVSALELNQGDAYSGRIARADVAAICAEAIASPAARDVTFECYARDTGKPLEAVGLSNLLRLTSSPADRPAPTGRERVADTWPALFTGLVPDS